MRIANFVTESSGGLRTALGELGAGYGAAGHEAVLIVPGARRADMCTAQGRVITLPAPEVPGMGGYRVLLDRRRTAALLRELAPDRVEVSDRATLRWVGRWARRAGVPSVMVSHESLDGLLRLFGPASSRFGLAALEALASGTPVVVSEDSALPEVIGGAGIAAAGEGSAYARAVLTLMDRPERRRAARERARGYPWAASVAGFLAAHGVVAAPARR
ncbi:glycosyltransferase [Actinoplanes sp. NPDC026623]|uniref:glycosyltransferase n=1 Tax=Actinoplanes sp. NPDC026623 TaxID=3155610 RepID=UPI0033EB8061